jgi:hypothetical protein
VVGHGLVLQHVHHLQELQLHGFDRGGRANHHTARPYCVRELFEHALVDFRRAIACECVDTFVHDGGECGSHDATRELEQGWRNHLCESKVSIDNVLFFVIAPVASSHSPPKSYLPEQLRIFHPQA